MPPGQPRYHAPFFRGRVYARLLNDRDRLDLHHIVRARQASDDEQRAGGGIGREALLTDLPYGGGVVEVGDIRRGLHDIVERYHLRT